MSRTVAHADSRPQAPSQSRRPNEAPADAARQSGSRYIAGPVLDTVFLIAAPLIGILAYLPFHFSDALQFPLPAGLTDKGAGNLATVFLTTFIFAHLVAVFFRSHVNRSIFRLYPYRFTVIPAVLLVACWFSNGVLVATMILGVWWDVYHSAMQTFGIGRIYDMKAGNNPLAGRRLDQVLNVLLYIGPIIGGVSLMLHLDMNQSQLFTYANVRAALFESVPFETRALATAAAVLGGAFLVYYLWSYFRLARNGYQVSYQKVCLLVILAVVSIACWGFNSFGEALFVMNFFHAWQYFFIVWFMERKHITSFFRMERLACGQQIALALFLALTFGFGLLAVANWDESPALLKQGVISLLIVVSIMHFWYDGFIWSVRRKQV